ncbi:4Fe-4S dicluster domain-containing protein [Desulfosediminicola flagellatus]|uniref:4Fe-4S dicluster domain-containing protein n=1 Tax=Desulfosediminicola flagellatus TaxID=2569541 RepID=UPI0010AB6D16|nr:4Fe-4S dicluster domain-containing protein [Desulfosediminicola flagellatus]
MAHHVNLSSYDRLTERLNRYPQGAPPSALLEQILKMLLNDREAELVSQLPIKPFTAEQAARAWSVENKEARNVLDTLAERAILVDIVHDDETHYILPPPMAGFFEFSLMRTKDDIDQKLLSELFHQYLNVEEDFVRELFGEGETQLGRVFVQEPQLNNENTLHVLDYERASEVIETASHMGISLCYCRHKMKHVGKACIAPMDICMTFNTSAASLIRHGHARKVDRVEGKEFLHKAYENNLVQFGENVRERVNFICNCCGCCCEAMLAAKRFANLHPVHTSNFLPVIDTQSCNGCSKCVNACPVEAMGLVSANDPHKPKRKRAKLDTEICLGCGVCVRACPSQSISLTPRDARVITPVNSAHRAVVMAIERGKLQNLIFDNQVLFSHRALAALFGAIFNLSPVKQLLASKQLKSKYLEALLARR